MIFAKRTYDVKGGAQICVTFYEPVKREDHFSWDCRFDIERPHRTAKLRGSGVDKLDAFLAAVGLVRMNLETKEEWLRGDMTWVLGTDLRLEVPVPESHVARVKERRGKGTNHD